MILDRTADWHTHSSLTDGADTWEDMAAAASMAGLHTLGASDHVRRETSWLPEYVAQIRALDRRVDLRVMCGVEAKILDSSGRLDIPAAAPPLDYVLVADHQFPAADGPQHPSAVRARIEADPATARDVVDTLVTAICKAVALSPAPAVVAHLFSIVPKVGLGEDAISDEHVHALAAACVAAGAAVEINEKWRCPGAAVVQGLVDRGVRIVAGSDAHRAGDVGRWVYLDELESRILP
ncbi:PHP domain-containing protein [Pseudactinotalea suaedae]|uniref:PHP domain-containing protein n=1 Tax=Pseudactinotalea suaedae TaxID=1524924 RepID=UPI0012E0FD4B|nr:PHP domain-containing protein [Pseudactinotalea suaedae]